MNEGEQTPENRPLTPLEAAKQYIKNRTSEIRYLGINAFIAGGLAIAGFDQIMSGNVRAGVFMAIGALGLGLSAAAKGYELKANVSRLADENAGLKENKQ